MQYEFVAYCSCVYEAYPLSVVAGSTQLTHGPKTPQESDIVSVLVQIAFP